MLKRVKRFLKRMAPDKRLNQRTYRLYALGDLEAAKKNAGQALRRFPDKFEVKLAYAKIYDACGIHDEVKRVLAPLKPDHSMTTKQLNEASSLLVRARCFDESNGIVRFLVVERKNAEAARALAYRRLVNRNHDGAIQSFTKMFKFGGNAAWSKVVHAAYGSSDDVVRQCALELEKPIRPDRIKPRFLKFRSLIAGRIGDHESSKKFIRTATEIDFKNKHSALEIDSDAQPLAPKFLIIGAMKCGTTTLHQLIMQHPKFLFPIEKEIQFFQFDELPEQWYREHFPRINPDSGYFSGEASPGYYLYDIIERVKRMLPDVKILFIQRDPVDRAISHLRHNQRTGISNHNVDHIVARLDEIEDAILGAPEEAENFLLQTNGEGLNQNVFAVLGLYEILLRRWKRAFGSDQLKVIRLEDLKASTQTVMDDIFDFIDVPRADVVLERANPGSYVKTDTKTLEAMDRLRRFYDKVEAATASGSITD